MTETLFETGEIKKAASIEAEEEADPNFKQALAEALKKHRKGKWQGEDKLENDLIVKEGFELGLRAEFMVNGKRVWIITSSERMHTTILFPDEF